MFQHTVDDLITQQPFNVYYLTVSGHPNYTFEGNMMAYKNREAVADLNYSDFVKAYLAANRELEYAMEYLMGRLEEAGIADDTVIVLTADHYPYGLEEGFDGVTQDYISELAGHTVEKNFELYKNTLIIWSGSMKTPVVVDEPCYSLDILPTISNLFGWEYDSRLLVGRDVFSGSTPLVLFRNYSWITDKGCYNASTETFTPNPGVTVPDDYAQTVSSIVKSKVKYSKYILEKDYYGVLFGSNK
jgi:phosphoglycerol transferase MdoB-like AlkP superfamily enzyme